MKKLFVLAVLALGFAAAASAQEGYKFTDQKVVKTVPITNQYKSGTCWCYSTLSYLEEEIMAVGGEQMTLSQMWVVRHAYFDKAVKYVRLHGNLNFAVGGAAHDVTEMIAKYGIVPREVYTGQNYGTELPEFNEIDNVLKAYVDAIIKNGNGKLTPVWQDGLNAILDTYFGERPETFTYKGKEYTPKSFAESLPIKMEDYIEISSYTHHPFYSTFILEVPDNWMWHSMYNLPVGEMMQVLDAALEAGRPVAWGTDVSEKGFSRTKAIGVIPEEVEKNSIGSDAERWGKLTDAEKQAMINNLEGPMKEKTITQEMRQEAYDNYLTTDDHGMVIVGTATDQEGNPFYKVQNSWGESGPYKGFYYFSRPFVEYKTMDIMVNKNIVPKEILKKLGLK
ncbi:MAG: aminopeptidase [Alistipes sp.]|nr:aminopeptidase [Alistipes sp.]MBQ3197332.1 aminopeptidase [Alistipes sp.]MBQ3212323.1 aminopeptidase [Alistipes sp.]